MSVVALLHSDRLCIVYIQCQVVNVLGFGFVFSALDIFLLTRYINRRFTYLLTLIVSK